MTRKARASAPGPGPIADSLFVQGNRAAEIGQLDPRPADGKFAGIHRYRDRCCGEDRAGNGRRCQAGGYTPEHSSVPADSNKRR